jgi:glycosyltransferase involved in cell wall biosynthesis
MTSTLPAISAIVLASNEEEDLPGCLESLAWVEELIVVVSSESTDKTVEVASKYSAKVFVRPWEGFARTRNWAVEQASHHWVLMVDADERVTPELAREISRAVQQADPVAYQIPRAFFFCGHRLRHGGCWPDEVLRLFRKNAGGYTDRHLHERFEPNGPVGRLQEPLLHYGYRDLNEYFEKFSRYAALGAKDQFERGKRFRCWNWLSPCFTFLSRYFLKAGFLDGKPGLVYALLGAAYVLARTVRLWELEQTDKTLKTDKKY